MTTNIDLENAIQLRDEYLKRHPHLQEFQNEIDNTLDKCRDQDRVQVITLMLGTSMQKLKDEVGKLQDMVKDG